MKKGYKKIVFILGTSICLGCVALFGGVNKESIISLLKMHGLIMR